MLFDVNFAMGQNVRDRIGEEGASATRLSETPVSDGNVEASNVDATRLVSQLCIVDVQHEHKALAKYWLASRRT